MKLELDTPRFRLRPLTATDVTERYVAWLNDPEVNRYLEVRFARQTPDSVKAYVTGHDNERRFLWGIFTPDGLHIGNYSLVAEPEHGRGTLGVMIGDRDWWGQNAVQETRAAILDFCFGELSLAKVGGACYANNRPAIYNYQRQGFAVDGVRKSHAICDGRRVDVIMFAMFADVWRDKRAQAGETG